jgi:hypothetical protein
MFVRANRTLCVMLAYTRPLYFAAAQQHVSLKIDEVYTFKFLVDRGNNCIGS